MSELQESVGEPVRWLDDPEVASTLRSDLAHGASANAAGVNYGATLTALRGAIAAQTAPLATTAAASGSGGLSIGIKLVLGVLVVGGIAVWAARGDVDATRTQTVAVQPQLDPDAFDEHLGTPTAPTQAPNRAQLPVRAPAPEQASPVAREPAPDDAAVEIVGPTEIESDDAPAERAAKARTRREGPSADRVVPETPSTASPAVDADRYVREAKLVAQARRVLAGDPARALALTHEHEREFPDGLLEQERRALAIRALAQLGRTDEARRAAKDFLAKFPDGTQAAAVRRAIEGDDTVP